MNEFMQAYRKLVVLNRRIHDIAPRFISTYINKPYIAEFNEYLNGRTVRRAIIVSPLIHGCQHRRATGGCFYCGEAYGIGVTPRVLYLKAIEKILSYLKERKIEWINWYVEGSNLNPAEVPKDLLSKVLHLFSSVDSVRYITIESRAEYAVQNEILEELSNVKEDVGVEIEVGVGIETRDDFKRIYLLNKGMNYTWNLIIRAIKKLKEYKLRTLGYVLLKPPFLTEKESIDDAVVTIREALKRGADTISLEIMSIHEFTLLEYLHLKGIYRLPWLYSVFDVMNTVKSREIRIGGEPPTYYPPSKIHAHNMDERSTAEMWKRIREYNMTHNLDTLYIDPSWEDYDTWREYLMSEDNKISLRDRAIKVAKDLNMEEYLTLKFWKGEKNGFLRA